MFVNKPKVAFKRKKYIQDIIGGYLIKDRKVAMNKLQTRQDKSKACNTTRSGLCYMQVVNTNTFRSNQTKPVFNIYHNTPYKSRWIIYLLECILFNIHYVGKSETNFNIRLIE